MVAEAIPAESFSDKVVRFGRFIENIPGLVAQTQSQVDRLRGNSVMAGICAMGLDSGNELRAVAQSYSGYDLAMAQARALHGALERAQKMELTGLFGLVALSPADTHGYPTYPSQRCMRMLQPHAPKQGRAPFIEPDMVIIAAGLGADNTHYRACTKDRLTQAYDNSDLGSDPLFSEDAVSDFGFLDLPLRRKLLNHLYMDEGLKTSPMMMLLSPAEVAAGVLSVPIEQVERPYG